MRIRGVAAVLLLCGGCLVNPVDLSDKAPPCGSGLVESCDGTKCVEPGVDRCPDGGQEDACKGAFKISTLTAVWSTSNGLAFTWIIEDETAGDKLERYELVLAGTAEQLSTRDGAKVYDRSINPELGFFSLPRTNAANIVRRTIARDLDPKTAYNAELTAFDRSGGSCTLTLAGSRTLDDARHEIPIYTDGQRFLALPEGDCWGPSSSPPHGGGNEHYEHHVECAGDTGACNGPDPGPCWSNYRLANVNDDLKEIRAGDFGNAFLEFEIDVEGAGADGFYSEAKLSFGGQSTPGGTERTDHVLPTLSWPETGGYHRFQLPLRMFVDLTHQTTNGSFLYQVLWGSEFPAGTTVRIDNVRIRWL